MTTEYVTKAEFARRCGFTRQHANKLVNTGVIVPEKDGKLNFEAAKAAWESSKKVGFEENGNNLKQTAATRTTNKVVQSGLDYNTARTRKEAANAHLKELELQEMQGILVPVDEVRADAAAFGGEMRAKFQAVGSRIATMCEGKEARVIERIISDEINAVLETLQASRFANAE